MINNTLTLMQSEEKRTYWNENPFEGEESMKVVKVYISQCLSTTVEIQIPKYSDEFDSLVLENAVREQIILPNEIINNTSNNFWILDDFCVTL